MNESVAGGVKLQGTDVQVSFGATVALSGTNFSLKAGEVHALLGENGAGKSTLMKVLAGIVRPQGGSLYLDGVRYAPQTPNAARKAGVAMIHQELALAPHLRVDENVVLGAEPMMGPFLARRQMSAIAQKALSMLGDHEIPLDVPASQLSVSASQLVEIARAIASGCRVMIMDEPTSSLGRKDVLALFELLRKLKAEGYAIVYISHFLEEVWEVADRFTVLRDGKDVATHAVSEVSVSEAIPLMIGAEMEQMYHRSERKHGEPLLNLGRLKGKDNRLDEATLTLRRGQILGIAGLVGSGRSELVRSVFGLDEISNGTIQLANYTGWFPPALRWKQGSGFLSEDRRDEGLCVDMAIADNLILPAVERVEVGGWLMPQAKSNVTSEWISKLGIRCSDPQATIRSLSGGNQQKVALARLLFCDVDLLILDEPTRGVDVKTKSQIYKIMDEVALAGKAVLMISSYLPELLGTCDQIAVMHRGRLSAPKNAAEWTEEELMLAVAGATDDTAKTT